MQQFSFYLHTISHSKWELAHNELPRWNFAMSDNVISAAYSYDLDLTYDSTFGGSSGNLPGNPVSTYGRGLIIFSTNVIMSSRICMSSSKQC